MRRTDSIAVLLLVVLLGAIGANPAAAKRLPRTAPSLQPGGSGWGLSEQKFNYPAILQDPHLPGLGVGRARIVIPWDMMINPAPLNVAERNAQETAIAQLRTGCGQPTGPCYDILISFEYSQVNALQLPSVTEYMRAVDAFRAAYPFIRDYEAWNEPNDPEQPTSRERNQNTYTGARQAGRYLRALQDSCRRPPTGLTPCTVVAGAFIDHPYTFSGSRPYVQAYIRGTGQPAWRASAWSIHPYAEGYGDINGTGHNHGAVSYLLRRTQAPRRRGASPPLWITEVGTRVDLQRLVGPGRRDMKTAAADLRYLLEHIATGLSPRIERFYYYSMFGEPTFDSGLEAYNRYGPCPPGADCYPPPLNHPRRARPSLYELYQGYTHP